jgi:hypothetical protein
MHRRFVSIIPLLVAAAAFVLTQPAFGAQQEHNHAAAAGSEHACACCGNSGDHAMNHAADGGCCSNMAADTAPKSEAGGCCAEKAADASAATPMHHDAQGCCGSMAMGKGEAGATATGDALINGDMQALTFPVENTAEIGPDDEAPPLE